MTTMSKPMKTVMMRMMDAMKSAQTLTRGGSIELRIVRHATCERDTSEENCMDTCTEIGDIDDS